MIHPKFQQLSNWYQKCPLSNGHHCTTPGWRADFYEERICLWLPFSPKEKREKPSLETQGLFFRKANAPFFPKMKACAQMIGLLQQLFFLKGKKSFEQLCKNFFLLKNRFFVCEMFAKRIC